MYYALIKDGRVLEVFPPLLDEAGEEIAIEKRYHPDFVALLVEYDPANPPPDPEPPEPTHAQLVELAVAATRIQRQPIISVLDGLQSSCLVKGETVRALALETAKQGLRDITNTDLSACVTYEEMRLAVKAAYIGLAMALPPDLRKAFSDAIN
jgi:hypothetical protein